MRLWIVVIGTLVGPFAGLLISDAALAGFSVGTTGIAVTTVLIWIIDETVALWVAAPVLLRRNSKPLAWLIDLAADALALIIANVALADLRIEGAGTFALAALIITVTSELTAVAAEMGAPSEA